MIITNWAIINEDFTLAPEVLSDRLHGYTDNFCG